MYIVLGSRYEHGQPPVAGILAFQVGRRIILDEFALVDDDDAVAHRFNFLKDMRREDNGMVLSKVFNQ